MSLEESTGLCDSDSNKESSSQKCYLLNPEGICSLENGAEDEIICNDYSNCQLHIMYQEKMKGINL